MYTIKVSLKEKFFKISNAIEIADDYGFKAIVESGDHLPGDIVTLSLTSKKRDYETAKSIAVSLLSDLKKVGINNISRTRIFITVFDSKNNTKSTNSGVDVAKLDQILAISNEVVSCLSEIAPNSSYVEDVLDRYNKALESIKDGVS